MSSSEEPISVVIPACRRIGPLLKTLARVASCSPKPTEILVHVDGADCKIIEAVQVAFPNVRVISSADLRGPGGSRNALVQAAHNELVANFDDDSFPECSDYFARVRELAKMFPDASVLSAANHDDPPSSYRFSQVSEASGCGCVFRKSWFLKVGGFVPLPIAYNMEEVDMGIRQHALGGVIIRDDELRVVHDKSPPMTLDAQTNAAVLMNTVLFPFLRFPVWLWPVVPVQVARRLIYLIKRGWTAGILMGLCNLPGFLIRHARLRAPLPSLAVISWLRLRRFPMQKTPVISSGSNQ